MNIDALSNLELIGLVTRCFSRLPATVWRERALLALKHMAEDEVLGADEPLLEAHRKMQAERGK